MIDRDTREQLLEGLIAFYGKTSQIKAFAERINGLFDAAEQRAEKAEQELADAKKDLQFVEESCEALEQKYKDCPHHTELTCACSYDRKSDVCMAHLPRVKQLEQELAVANEALRDVIDTQWVGRFNPENAQEVRDYYLSRAAARIAARKERV